MDEDRDTLDSSTGPFDDGQGRAAQPDGFGMWDNDYDDERLFWLDPSLDEEQELREVWHNVEPSPEE